MKVKVAQLCPTLCDPIDYRDHGILQARILESVAFPFSRGSSQLRDQTQVSHVAGGFFTKKVVSICLNCEPTSCLLKNKLKFLRVYMSKNSELGSMNKKCLGAPPEKSWREIFIEKKQKQIKGIIDWLWGLPWWLRWWRIHLQRRRPGFDPWVREIPWRKEWLTHANILAWRTAWIEEPGDLQSMGLQRVRHAWETNIHIV